ncbi:hypothetical protein SAMN05216421_1075 [Halopseudomonas xinjiangensis]|uniref:Uncharacterized protein n=2 Tax=Halopseudomonas xinjiangensis TaxID=487184 RepID=A0A1H1Q797_9GAMM|nr:hypothetical protein SAMN05216421_1075 [Halopseudomonas xinjiangensis]
MDGRVLDVSGKSQFVEFPLPVAGMDRYERTYLHLAPYQPPSDDMRARFEAWAVDRCFDITRSNHGGYRYGETQAAWEAWQECEGKAAS